MYSDFFGLRDLPRIRLLWRKFPRGLIPGPSMIVVPAHLGQKWQEELENFFGVRSSRLTPEVARDPKDLDPRVDVWITSLDLFTHNPDVRIAVP